MQNDSSNLPPVVRSVRPSQRHTESVSARAGLGTPHQSGSVKVMLLGAGELGKEVAIAFQRLGVEVIAVDRYPAAPAQQVAHRAYTMDMTDGEELYRLIDSERPALVVPEIEALATDALIRAELDGITTVIPTARAVQLTMNREGIRRLAAEDLHVPTSSYEFASSLAEVAQACEKLGFPCFVKPVMSSSGKGQSLVKYAGGVAAAWSTAMKSGRVSDTRVIVEKLVDFDFEITLLTVRAVNADTGEVETHFCEPIGHRQVAGDYVQSWQPQPMSESAYHSAQAIALEVTAALGGLGVFGVELFVQGDHVIFSEVSPRPHDTGLVTLRSQQLSEFELHARAVLGLPVSTVLTSPAASAVIKASEAGSDLRFGGVEKALSIPETDIRLFAKPEATVGRRLGVVVATADDIDTALDRATSAAALVTIDS